jgi:GrpB-like predicted nucleotidyltransferase (UPF0157 family)
MPDPPDAPDAPVCIVPYDATWPEKFEAERALLARVLGDLVRGPIEHVGSTAVPDLAAKPIVDIMAGVKSLAASEPAKQRLAAHGYQYAPYEAELMHWFCKPSPAYRTHHLHLVPYGSELYRQRLEFRDRLRADPRLAAEYAALKRELARQNEWDREAYTNAKWPFVRRVLGLP